MAFTQNDDNQEQTQQNGALTTGGGQGSAVGNTPGAGPVSTANPNKQGSGRFTNLSKYVQANKQGSENLANRIGSGIQSQLSSNERDVSGKASKLDTDIKTGDATLKTAGAEEQRLKSIGDQFKANQNFKVLDPSTRGEFGTAQTNLKSFVTDNPNYSTFKSAQAGSAVDEVDLSNQLQNTQQNAALYNDIFKQRQAQVGNTQGREQALQEFVGGANQAVRPTYTSGQRKLDQLILGQNAQNLQGLINKVGSNQANVDNAFNKIGALGTDLSKLKTSEQDVIKNIGDTSLAAQSAFQTAFNTDKLKEINDARKSNYENVINQIYSGNISGSDYDKLGLNALGANTATFNLLDELRGNNRGGEFVTRKGDVINTNELGNASDVESDSFLSDIIGNQSNRKFTQAGDLSTDYGVNQANGKSALTQAIQDRQNRELQDAANTNLAYEGKDSYWDWGRKKEKRQTSTGSVADLLGGGFTSYGDRGDVRQGAAQDYARYLAPFLTSGGGAVPDAVMGTVNNLSNAVMGNQSGGAADAAYSNSVRGLFGQLQDYMNQRGYGKGLTKV